MPLSQSLFSLPASSPHYHQALQCLNRVFSAYFSGDATGAEREARKLLVLNPLLGVPVFALLAARSDFHRGVLIMERAHRIVGYSGQVTRIGQLLAAGRIREADSHARNEMIVAPGSRTLLALLVECAERSGQTGKTEARCAALLAAHPGAGEGYAALARLALRAGRPDRALALARRARLLCFGPKVGATLIQALTRAGRLREAARLASTLMNETPHSAEVAWAAAEVAWASGDLTRAAMLAREAHLSAPDVAEYLLGYATAVRELGAPAAAIRLFLRAAEMGKDAAPALRGAADCEAMMGRHHAALSFYQKALHISPEDIHSRYGSERIVEMGLANPAVIDPPRPEETREHRITEEDEVRIGIARAWRMIEAGRHKEAILVLGKLASKDARGGVFLPLAEAWADLGEPGRAAEALRSICRRRVEDGDPEDEDILSKLAHLERCADAISAPLDEIRPEASLDGERHWEWMLDTLERLMAAAPTAPWADDAPLRLQAGLMCYGLLYQGGRLGLAGKVGAHLLERFPDAPAVQQIRIDLLLHRARFAEAGKLLDALEGEEWVRAAVSGLRGQIAGGMGDHEGAAAAFRRAADINSALAYPLINAGDSLLKVGRREEALKAYREAVERLPAAAMPHQNYALHQNARDYRVTGMEGATPDPHLLIDGFNRAGEQMVHRGGGSGSTALFANALRCNTFLGEEVGGLPDDLAAALGIGEGPSGKRVRILPPEWVVQIGHMGMLDIYAKMRILGWKPDCPAVLLAPPDRTVNRAYLEYWRRYFIVVEDDSLIERLLPFQRMFGECFNGWVGEDGIELSWPEMGARSQMEWDRLGRAPLLSLSAAHRERGRRVLEEYGLGPDDWFVALHMRDAGYHAESDQSSQNHRNVGSELFLPAIRAIQDLGGWVVRMGDAGMRPIPDGGPRFIDYARGRSKSDWMDVFLCGAARLFVGSTSGLSNLAVSFGTPSALVNCVSNYAQLWSQSVTFTWRPLLRDEGGALSLREMLEPSVRWSIFNNHELRSRGLSPLDNDPEDVTACVMEALGEAPDAVGRAPSDELREWLEVANESGFFGAARPGRAFAAKYRRFFFPGGGR